MPGHDAAGYGDKRTQVRLLKLEPGWPSSRRRDVMRKMVCRVRDHVIHHEGTMALPQDRHQRLACPWDGYVGNCLALHGDYEHNTTDLTSVKPKEIICQLASAQAVWIVLPCPPAEAGAETATTSTVDLPDVHTVPVVEAGRLTPVRLATTRLSPLVA